jgi:hypothetical protein
MRYAVALDNEDKLSAKSAKRRGRIKKVIVVAPYQAGRGLKRLSELYTATMHGGSQ